MVSCPRHRANARPCQRGIPDRDARHSASFLVQTLLVAERSVVTFLFTDIEGSTRLWEAHPAAMEVALARHDELLRVAIEGEGGVVFKTVGDAFCATFPAVSDSVRGAAAAQRALTEEPWPSAGDDTGPDGYPHGGVHASRWRLLRTDAQSGRASAGDRQRRPGPRLGVVATRVGRTCTDGRLAARHGRASSEGPRPARTRLPGVRGGRR